VWSGIFITGSIFIALVLYTMVMFYCNARILSGYRSNRNRVFQEQAELKKRREQSVGSTAKGDSEATDDKKNAPYVIAGFFHPYW